MPVGIKRKVRSEKVFVLESDAYKCHDPPNPWVTTCNCNVKGSSIWMVFTYPFFSALCYCCHLVPFVNSKLLATTPILERASYGKGSECLRVNCKHPLKEDSDVLVGRANKLRWTKVYKGSELQEIGAGGRKNSRLRRSVVSPTKPSCYASYREKKAFLILEKSFEGRWKRQPHPFSTLCSLCQLSSTLFQARGTCVLEYV